MIPRKSFDSSRRVTINEMQTTEGMKMLCEIALVGNEKYVPTVQHLPRLFSLPKVVGRLPPTKLLSIRSSPETKQRTSK